MAPNKRKILEAARKHVQKGAKDRALKEYEKLLKLEPQDAKLRLEIGDTHRRWGQVDEAVAAYTRVAEQYMKEGFDARAVAVFKQIQNLDAERYDSYLPLSELYQRMGLSAEAIQALQTAADGYRREGRKREALELLRRMATLDPTNTISRLKVADLLQQENLHEEAISEYEAVHEEFDRQGDSESAGNALERILELAPDRVETLIRLGRNLLQRGSAERAEPFARRAIEAEPDEIGHVELLADIYRAQQRDTQLAETYRSLAEIYRRRGDEDRAREIIQRFVPPDELASPLAGDAPGDETALDDEAMLSEADMLGADAPELLGDDLLDDDLGLETDGIDPASLAEETLLDVRDRPRREAVEEAWTESRQLDEELEPQPDADAEQLLAEASVYLRYGKRASAVRNLEAILVAEPEHLGALEKLGEAHADAGNSEGAVDAWLRAADGARAQGDQEGLLVLRDRIAALDPQAARNLGVGEPEPEEEVDPLIELAGETGDDFTEEAEPAHVTPGLEEPELDFHGDIEIDVDDLEPTHADEAPPAASTPVADASASRQLQEDLEEADFYRQQGLLSEARALYERVLGAAPNHPLALVRLGEIAAEQGEDPGASAPDLAVLPGVEPEEDGAELDDSIGEDLAEWSDDGLSDAEVESVSPLEELAAPLEAGADRIQVDLDFDTDDGIDLDADLGPDPSTEDSADVDVDAVTGVELPLEEEEPPADGPGLTGAAPEPAEAGASFDLAAELSEALDDQEGASGGGGVGSGEDDGFAAVFREFKKGVSNALGDRDHEAHYDLGIAYREMGLLEDAVSEFQASLESPARRVDSLHMLGLCALDLGRAADATRHLGAALDTPGVSHEQSLAVRFELGRAFESLGDLEKTREVWEAVAAVDPGFCEVEERLASLGEAKPEPDEDGFESFVDLFEESVDQGGAGIAAADRKPAQPISGPDPAERPPRPRKKRISFV